MNNDYAIYAHIFPNGKVYIGQTCRKKPESRWGKNGNGYLILKEDGSFSQPMMANAIKKYGWDNIEHRILYQGLTKLDADMIEQDLIYYYKKENRSYNIQMGGGGFRKEHTQTKEEKAAYAKKYRETHKEEMSARNKEWASKHKEERDEYMKQWREANRERIAAHYQQNKEAILARQKGALPEKES